MEQRYTVSTSLVLAFLAAIFAVEVYQAATHPIRAPEAYVYDRFVRPTTRQVLAQELPNRDVLYTLLEKRSVGLFHVSPFSVRLPSLMFAILYFRSAWRLAQRIFGTGWRFLATVTLAGLFSLWWGGFVWAQGQGAALALQVSAAQLALSVKPRNLNLAGACLGLSVAASLDFAMPAAALALGFLAVDRRWVLWTDRILIPATVAALVFLVLPLSHAHAASEAPPDPAASPASAIRALRSSAGDHRVRIGASPAIEPILNFYRAQHRLTTWDRAERWDRAGQNPAAGDFDYYLLTRADAGLVDRRHLLVLYRDADFVLAAFSIVEQVGKNVKRWHGGWPAGAMGWIGPFLAG